jgi:hypothetical protein
LSDLLTGRFSIEAFTEDTALKAVDRK